MANLISPSLLVLRRDSTLLRLPYFASALCVVVGVIWLLLLPLDEYSRSTYISENALLPGQVHTYFGGTEQNIFDAYRHEVEFLAEKSQDDISTKLKEILKSSGLKVASQRYKYRVAGNEYGGENVYAVLHAPRGDATEAIVLVAALKSMDDEPNISGVALALTLARYFKRWSLWSKDIIFLISSDSKAGPQAWVEAYHDSHSPLEVESLPLKSGALEGAIVIENPLNHRFESIHITYDGINGQLPNLDLFNTAVSIAMGQHGMGAALQKMWKHSNDYADRLRTMLRGMASQGLGHASGPHSSFIPYHVDAITLRAVGEGREDDMAYGRVVESLFRSLNNLMEHFHQSFFLYILMHTHRFVSIGTYLPSAMLVAGNFTIMAIALWIASGRPPKQAQILNNEQPKSSDVELVKKDGVTAVIPKQELNVAPRDLLLPITFILCLHFLGVVPLYTFNNIVQSNLAPALFLFALANAILPIILKMLLSHYAPPTPQQSLLLKCFSLLLLGMFLATLATVNFSLSLLIGLLSAPLSFIGASPADSSATTTKPPSPSSTPSSKPSKPSTKNNASPPSPAKTSPYPLSSTVLRGAQYALLLVLSPPVVILAACRFAGVSVEEALLEAAFGWHVWGLWTQVIVCCVWWPAWLAGAVGVAPEF